MEIQHLFGLIVKKRAKSELWKKGNEMPLMMMFMFKLADAPVMITNLPVKVKKWRRRSSK